MAQIFVRNVPQFYLLTPAIASAIERDFVLVFLHGWLLSSAYWQPLIDQLQCHVRCLSYDLRGFGQSLTSTCPHTLVSYIEDLAEILDRLQIAKVWLVGHSLGGTLALWGAHLMAERVLGVVCINSGGGIYIDQDFRKLRWAGRIIAYARPQWLAYLPWLADQFAKDSVHQPLAWHWGKQRVKDFVSADLRAVLGILLDSTTEREVHLLPQLVAGLKQPAYFVAGECDRIMQAKFVKHLASFHPLFQQGEPNYWEIANCGHIAMLEHADLIRDLLLRLTVYNQISSTTPTELR